MRRPFLPLLPLLSLVLGGAATAHAQLVPARDLFRFPLGSMDRAPALGASVGDGLGNPAAVALPVGARALAGAAALQTPGDIGVRGQLLAAAGALPGGLTVALSLAHLSVDDLVRTETDPQTVGDEIPYSTSLYSVAVARRNARHVSTGLALRYRQGRLDDVNEGAFYVDGGVFAEHLPFRDASLGAATFLWRPGHTDEEPLTVNLAADLRVLGPDDAHQLRAGYSLSVLGPHRREHFGFGVVRYGIWEGRAGLAKAEEYGGQPWRTRLGLLVDYAPYAVGVAREENGAGLGASYQFTLRATIR
ncbi:MAG TPA: hypothetical protein VFS05_16925 [Gemmatimonadaceae bacterium]|nr:hypothetical protein [Gemmatimonadaceae bacterium]